MSRPTNKAQLLHEAEIEYAALEAALEKITPEQMLIPNVCGEWSAKDVIAHIAHWATMCLGWYSAGKRGEVPRTPSEEFTWRETPALNQRIYELHRDESLEIVLVAFRSAHREMLNAIGAMTEEELFTPKFYTWTNTSTLGSYLTSASCSHYTWAKKEIRKGLNPKQSKPTKS